MRPKNTTKMARAIQFTSCTTVSLLISFFSTLAVVRSSSKLIVGGEVDNGRENGADDNPEELKPVKEGDAHQGGLEPVVQGWPERHEKLDDEKQIPPAPAATPSWFNVHCDHLPPLEAFSGPYPKGKPFVNLYAAVAGARPHGRRRAMRSSILTR